MRLGRYDTPSGSMSVHSPGFSSAVVHPKPPFLSGSTVVLRFKYSLYFSSSHRRSGSVGSVTVPPVSVYWVGYGLL